MLSLLGLITLYVKSGANTFDLIALKQRDRRARSSPPLTQHYAFGLLMFGFGILVSLWPLHTWAPLGYGAAPTSTAMLHAGVLKKFGLYGLIQIAVPLLPAGAAAWAWKLALLAGIGNVLVVGFVTMAQRDLKQMLGYSSVMHMGYCFLGIAALSTIGTGGVVLLMVAHGLSVALLFMLATYIHHRTHTFDMSEMGGLAQKTPVLAAFSWRPPWPASACRGLPTSGVSSRSSWPSGISHTGSPPSPSRASSFPRSTDCALRPGSSSVRRRKPCSVRPRIRLRPILPGVSASRR